MSTGGGGSVHSPHRALPPLHTVCEHGSFGAAAANDSLARTSNPAAAAAASGGGGNDFKRSTTLPALGKHSAPVRMWAGGGNSGGSGNGNRAPATAAAAAGYYHAPPLSKRSAPAATSLARASFAPSTGGAPSAAAGAGAVMHKAATTRLLQLSTAYRTRRELEALEGVELPKTIAHPLDRRMQWWWVIILISVLVTMVVEPYSLAFAAFPGLYPWDSPDTIISLTLMIIYATDIVLNFNVAYHDEDGALVTDRLAIAKHYAEWRLWVDLLTTIPFDWIVLAATHQQYASTREARFISLLRLLRLGRVYRLRKWAVYLLNNARVSLFVVTITRNVLIVFFSTHLTACLFYYMARQNEHEHNWVVGAMEWLDPSHVGVSTFARYLWSLYFATVTFATLGYGDIRAYTLPEACFLIVVVVINVFLGAYIIGTITLLVTRGDEEAARYRGRLAALQAYATANGLPKDLQSALRGHLRLHFSASEESDESVLAGMPGALRRRVLRHLYLGVIEDSWLLTGTRVKFLDAVLASARVEHIMPRADVVCEGDHVNELIILVTGSCLEEIRGGSGGEHVALDPELASVHGTAHALGPGDALGEFAFFAETPSAVTVRTLTVCRVLSLPRASWVALAASFPRSAERVFDNLLARAEELLARQQERGGGGDGSGSGHGSDASEVKAGLGRSAGARGNPWEVGGGAAAASLRTVLNPFDSFVGDARRTTPAAGASDDGGGGGGRDVGAGGGGLGRQSRAGRHQQQQQFAADLLRVRVLVEGQRQRLARERTAEFLEAAQRGNVSQLRQMLQHGMAPDSADYGGRTALMVAAAHGQTEAVLLLLAAGADPSRVDKSPSGGCALLEAARRGHDDVLHALVAARATLPSPPFTPVACAVRLCTAVFEGDVALLRRLLRAGLPPNSADYDGRTAAHVAAADGALPALRALVEAGADLGAKDRWDSTPLDESRRVGATAAVAYLEEQQQQQGQHGQQQQIAPHLSL